MRNIRTYAIAAWQLGALVSFVHQTLFERFYMATWQTAALAIPGNIVIAEIWPVYYLMLRPVFGL